MKRDATGRFTSNWDFEAKRRVSVTLTNTAWQLLEEEAQQHGISRSEVIERTARSFAAAKKQSAAAIPPSLEEVNALRQRLLELEQSNSQCQQHVAHLTQQLHQEKDARQQAEDRLHLTLIAAQVVAWDMDLTANQVVCSSNAQDLWGIQAGTAEDFFTAIHPDDRQHVIQAAERAIAGETDYLQEYRVIRPDGAMRWLRSQGQAFLNDAGQGVRIIGLSVDITERKQTEAALRLSEERLHGFVSANVIGILYGDFEGGIQDANDEFLRIVGYTREDLQAGRLRWIDITPPEYLPLDAERIAEARRRGACTPFEKEYIRKDGRRVPVLVGFGLVLAVREEAVAFILDLSDRKQAEESLRQSEERYRYLAESIPQLVWTANAKGALMDVNQRWCAFTGLTLEEAQTAGWAAVVHPDDVSILGQNWAIAQQNGSYYQAEGRMRRADGVYRWHLHQAVPLKNDQGQLVKWFGTATDIEDQKQLEQQRIHLLQQEQIAREQAETANRIKDEFLAVLSHELRTPLNPILGWARLLRTRQFDSAASDRALETIERNAKLQAQLVEDLLDISRILQGKVKLEASPVNLVPVIDAALETVRLSADAKGIQIQTVLNPDVGLVNGDMNRLQQVVWNLLSNAVKFTPSGGRVEVNLERFEFPILSSELTYSTQNSKLKTQNPKHYAQITVSDTGQGIKSDFLPYVFEYFRQADSSTTRQFGGLGLGLAIVRHLVELHGGAVKAESLGQNMGATFTVQLPLMTSVPTPDLEVTPIQDTKNLNNINILIVDDEADVRNLMKFLLEEQGAAVTVAASAAEALQKLTTGLPDVLISDIGMPEMDGYALMQQIRATLSAKKMIPAIALTAYAGEADQRQALSAGFQLHLSKPIEPEQLIKSIVQVIH